MIVFMYLGFEQMVDDRELQGFWFDWSAGLIVY